MGTCVFPVHIFSIFWKFSVFSRKIMGVIQRVVKPRNQRSKRALENREPKALESNKGSLFIRGTNCTQTVLQCMKDLHCLKKPDSDFYSQKNNDIRPFENFNQIEFWSQKHDISLFALGNSNKKRPDNLILGRLYDHKMLDMVEFGVNNFKAMSDFGCGKIPVGTKPCLLFSGSLFDTHDEIKRIKNLLVDFFRGPRVPKIRLQGLEHALQFTAVEKDDGKKVIYLRSYKIELRKSGSRIPRVELEEMGPMMDLEVRRTHMADEDYFNTACKKVKNVDKPKVIKNVSKDAFGSTIGRIHIPAQKIGTIQTRKMKGLKETQEEKQEKIQKKKEKANAVRKANIAAVFSE